MRITLSLLAGARQQIIDSPDNAIDIITQATIDCLPDAHSRIYHVVDRSDQPLTSREVSKASGVEYLYTCHCLAELAAHRLLHRYREGGKGYYYETT